MEKLQKTRHGALKGTFEEITSQFIIHHFLLVGMPERGWVVEGSFLTTYREKKERNVTTDTDQLQEAVKPRNEIHVIPALPGFNLLNLLVSGDKYDIVGVCRQPVIAWRIETEVLKKTGTEGIRVRCFCYPITSDHGIDADSSTNWTIEYHDGRFNVPFDCICEDAVDLLDMSTNGNRNEPPQEAISGRHAARDLGDWRARCDSGVCRRLGTQATPCCDQSSLGGYGCLPVYRNHANAVTPRPGWRQPVAGG